MSKFKVGDKVRCIDDGPHPYQLTKNRAHYISGIGNPIGNVRLVGIEDRYSYCEHRFEKVVSNKRKT